MIGNTTGSPIFADRYRFQPVGADWDVGRSGLTHLVFDIKKERLGVMKRAELKSPRAVEGLKNEVAVLLDLKGQGVPEVYDTGDAEYGSKTYFYMVIEYIEGTRIEKNLETLSATARAEILTQFFALLAKAHKMGVVNGDVDLKHLFWNKDKNKLTVIDWGNARLDVDQKKKSEFSYDLARSAEIVYSLVTRKGPPSATGSLALPANSALVSGMAPVPDEFRALCKWAPRTPSDGVQAPYTAQTLLEVAKDWRKAVQDAKPYKQPRRSNWGVRLIVGIIMIAAVYLGVSPDSPLRDILFPSTSTPIEPLPETASPLPTETEIPPTVEVLPSTVAPTEETPLIPTLEPSPTITPEPVITPTPLVYTDPALVLDRNVSTDNCWTNETNSPLGIRTSEGFTRRSDGNWRFGLNKDQTTNFSLQTNFTSCVGGTTISALAMNVWIARLELERDSPDKPGTIDPGKEFGIYLEDSTGMRHEYTIWVDKTNSMHLRVRKGIEILSDDVLLVINEGILKIEGAYPRVYAIFPIQIFLEIDNQGLDILYLKQGPVQVSVKVDDLDPNQMIKIDKAVLPTLGTVQKIGLIGYGGEAQTVIWPLVFYGE